MRNVCASTYAASASATSLQQFSFAVQLSAVVCIVAVLQAGWDDNQMKYLLRELLIHQELSACRYALQHCGSSKGSN
jgi:hypothetical protein